MVVYAQLVTFTVLFVVQKNGVRFEYLISAIILETCGICLSLVRALCNMMNCLLLGSIVELQDVLYMGTNQYIPRLDIYRAVSQTPVCSQF